MDLHLSGKVAVVTGASKGIGRAVAAELAQEGADVAIAARTPGPLELAAKDIAAATGRTIMPIAGDMSVTADVERCMAAVIDRFGVTQEQAHELAERARSRSGASASPPRLPRW
jgi:NAD(P)-dependent dehydrogenase (short-subunit alcohol dehydrogenase family)